MRGRSRLTAEPPHLGGVSPAPLRACPLSAGIAISTQFERLLSLPARGPSLVLGLRRGAALGSSFLGCLGPTALMPGRGARATS